MKKQSPDNRKEISCRVSRTLIMYVRECNNGSLGNLLDNFPMDESFLCDTNQWISHQLLQDLYQRMITLLNDPKAVYHMTLASGRFQSLGILDRIMRLIGNPRRIYSQAPLYNKFLKLNGSVFIHEINDTSALIEDRYHENHIKTRHDCDYTRGILAGIPTLFGLPEATVEEVECQVTQKNYGRRSWPDTPCMGGRCCLYKVAWKTNRVPFFRRLFFKRFHQKKAIEDLANANQLIQAKYDEVKSLLKALQTRNHQLMESEHRFRLLEENIADSVWMMDLKTLKLNYVSPSVIQNRGYTPEESKALDIESSLSPESYQHVMKILSEELAKDGQPGIDPNRSRTIELREKLKNGGYTWSETRVCFLRDRKGNPNEIMGVTRYIDERKKAEEKIAASEKKYRSLFENVSDLLCIHDLNGVLIDTNLHHKAQYGLKKKDLHGKNIRNLIPEKNRAHFDTYLEKILSNGKDEGYLSGVTPLGEKIILEYRNSLLFDEKGKPIAVHGAARDVTQQFKAQKALKESEDKYRNIVRYAPAGIYEFDLEKLRFISVNDVMCEYTGYSQEDFLSMNPESIITEDSRSTLEETIEKAYTDHPSELSTEYKLRAKNGRIFQVLANARFFYEDGKPKRAMAIVHDLTEIRKAEEERRQLENRLQQAHKMEAIGTLAGGIAHDFNNILAGILGYCDLINQNIFQPEKAKAQVKRIRQGAERAADLVRQILDFSRKTEYQKKRIYPFKIIEEVVKLFRSTLPATILIQEKILSENAIYGDPGKVHQVLMNLCTNAYHAMTETGGTLSIQAKELFLSRTKADPLNIKPGSYIQINIKDTGHGMSKEILNKIFDPYFTTKAAGKGTGIGLSIVYTIITEHQGTIQVESTPGKGTLFSVFLPIVQPEKAVETITEPEKNLFFPSGKGEKIMVVDDEQTILESTKELLEDFGYQVEAYPDGESALAAFYNNPSSFNLVLTDMTMPKMTGTTLAQKIFQTGEKTPVVLCTGFNENISEKEALEMGIVKFLQKPVVNRPLPDIIREILNENAGKTS